MTKEMRAAENAMAVEPVIHERFNEIAGDVIEELRYDLKLSRGIALAIIHPTQGGELGLSPFSGYYNRSFATNNPKDLSGFTQKEEMRVNTNWQHYVTNLLSRLTVADKLGVPIIWGLEVLEDFERNPQFVKESVVRTTKIIGSEFVDRLKKVYFYPAHWSYPHPLPASYKDTYHYLPAWIKLLKKETNIKHTATIGQQFNGVRGGCVFRWLDSAEKAGVSTTVMYDATYGYT